MKSIKSREPEPKVVFPMHPRDYCGTLGKLLGVTAKQRRDFMKYWKRQTGKELEPNE